MTSGSLVGNVWQKVFQRTEDIVARRIVGELLLVPIKGNLADMQNIFALTSVGEFIWDRLDGHRTLSDIRNDVVATFDVDEGQAGSDIQEYVTELMTEGLVQEVVN